MAFREKIEEALQSVNRMTERLLYSQHVLGLRDRSERMRIAVANPDLTTADILRADFGTDCPRGLDVKAYPEKPVNLGALEDAEHVRSLGYFARRSFLSKWAGTGGDAIDMRHDYLRALKAGTIPPYAVAHANFTNMLGHENTHMLQWMFAGMDAPVDIPEGLSAPGAGIMGRLGDLFRRVAQAGYDSSQWLRRKPSIPEYFAQNIEVQARIHEIMATGYVQWKKLPATPMELRAALLNMGIEAPLTVRGSLHFSSEGRRALEEFSCDPVIAQAASRAVNEINRVISYATLPARRAFLWNEAFPAIYGHLTELYGDSQGRARMGLGVNPAPEYRMMAAVHNQDMILTPERATMLTAGITPEKALPLFNQLSLFSDSHKNFEVMAAALLRNPETRAAIVDHGTLDMRLPYTFPPLHAALYAGKVNTLKLLLAAEYDVDRTTSYIDRNGAEFKTAPLRDCHLGISYLDEKIAAVGAELSENFNGGDNIADMRKQRAQQEAGLYALADYYGDDWRRTAPPSLHEALSILNMRRLGQNLSPGVSAPAAGVQA